MRVMEVARHKGVVDDLHAFQHVVRLGNHLPPSGPFRPPRIDCDYPLLGRVQVGSEVEDWAVVPHEVVPGVEVVQEAHDRTIEPRALWVPEVLIIDPVATIGAEPHGEHQVAAVGAHIGGESPVRLVRPLVDELVGGLVGAEPVVVDLLVTVDRQERVAAGSGLRVAAVEEPCAIVRPGGAGELDPLQVIGTVAPRRDIAHAEFLPIRSAARGAVQQQPSILGERERRQRDGAVGRECVGVQQLLRFGGETRLRVQHGLILEAGVLEEEVAPALLERRAVLGIVPQRRQPAPDPFALRNLSEVRERDTVFRLDPGRGLGRVHVLEPPIRVGDLGAVVVVNHVTLARGGI